MQAYEVGRPAVREALFALQRMGLIAITHGDRARVVEVSADAAIRQVSEMARFLLETSPRSLEHLKEVRAFFEVGMVRIAAAKATKADIARLRRALEEHEAALADGQQFLDKGMAFHHTIAGITGNPIFEALSRAMLEWLQRFHTDLVRAPGREPVGLAEHVRIFECIARHDPDAAALFILGLPIAILIGAPLSTALLGLDGLADLRGWQWMFIAEGLPAIAIGVIVLGYLTDRPEDAKRLSPGERAWLADPLAKEVAAKTRIRTWTIGTSLRDAKVLTLAGAFFCNVIPICGITSWLPQIVKSAGGLTTFQTGLVTPIPYVCAAVAMVLNARHSDRTGERKLHILASALIGAAGFVVAATAASPWVGLLGICICIGACGIWAANTIFWTLPAAFLTGAAAAAGIGLINAVGNLGGFVGPYLTGWIKDAYGSYAPAMLLLAAFLSVHGTILYWFVRRAEARGEVPQA